jgi:hypothetical protein
VCTRDVLRRDVHVAGLGRRYVPTSTSMDIASRTPDVSESEPHIGMRFGEPRVDCGSSGATGQLLRCREVRAVVVVRRDAFEADNGIDSPESWGFDCFEL